MTTTWRTLPMAAVMAEFYDGPHATPAPAERGPIYLGIKNITEDGRLDLSDIRHIAEKDFGKWTRRVEPRPGDVVFTYEASLHRYAIIPNGFRGTLGRRVALLRANPNIVDTRFLLYAFVSPQWRRTVEARINIGSTVDRLPLVDFPKYPISLPPLPTQRKIAAILSAYDELIENNARRIKVLEELAQRIYSEWFVDFRYPGHEEIPLRDSDIGPIPQGWQLLRTSDLISRGCLAIGDGYRAKNSELGDQGLPFVRIGDLRDDFTFDGVDRLLPASISAAGSKVSRDGDCVVSTKGSVGRVLMVPRDSPRFVYSPQLSYWRTLDQTLLREYLISWMRGPEFVRQCATVKGATDMADYVNLKDQRRMLIPIPPDAIQQMFQRIAGPPLVATAKPLAEHPSRQRSSRNAASSTHVR